MTNNELAFSAGTVAGNHRDHERDAAYTEYRISVVTAQIEPSVSASVCFVAGYLGKAYPSHDDRVTS